MDGILRLITNENIDLVFQSFNFYLPPLYSSILHEIQIREQTLFITMIVGYTDRRTLPIVFATYDKSKCRPETSRLLTLNRIEWIHIQRDLLIQIQQHTIGHTKLFKLIAILNFANKVESVLVFIPKIETTFDQFVTSIEFLEHSRSTHNERYKLLNYNILDCNSFDIQQAIENENIMYNFLIEKNSINLKV